MNCGVPFSHGAARIVRVRAAEVFEHTEGVLDLGNIEPLHDMRVATRRLRAALEMFEACFPRKRFRRTLKKVKALADALGERRDRDVEIEFLVGFAEAAPEAERALLAARIATLREEQRAANEALAPLLAEKRLAKLRRRLERLAKEAK